MTVMVYERLGEVFVRADDGLTAAEDMVMRALIDAIDAYGSLPAEHPDEIREFVSAIHRCQDLLAVRIARRHYPQRWPTHRVA